MKNQKLNYTSLTKTKNINRPISTSKNDLSFFQKTKGGPFYLLPLIDKNITNIAYHKPTSILTKYISDQAHKIIQKTEEDLKKPIIIENIKKKIKNNSMSHKGNNQLKNMARSRNKTVSDEINIKDLDKLKVKDKEKRKINNFYLTAQNQKDTSTNSRINTNGNEYSNKVSTEPNILDNDKQQNKNEERLSIRQSGIKKKHESSMSLDRKLTKEKAKFLSSTFRRIRSYQPKIEENWKFAYGLTVNVGPKIPIPGLDNSIEHQSKLINDQYKLLVDNIFHYRMSIITKDNYLDSFKCLSLKNKISYNKALEEVCGLLLLLPQLILVEFYKYIEKFEGMSVPNKKKFKDKYIFDEISCLLYNNKLLSEVSEYFQNCFEVYLILIKEVDDMTLNPKNFTNVLSAFEKARYDICFASNMAENAMNDYNKELNYINKLDRIDMIKKKLNNKDVTDIIRINNNNKKNSERQRRLRIEACLSTKEEEINQNKNKDLIFHKENKITNNRKFKSIIDSILVTKILKHCKKDVKYEINTQRINNEMDEIYSGELGKTKNINKVIKLNF